MTMRTRQCDDGLRAGRLHKAREFLDAARKADDPEYADATVTLLVHAGIAAADVLCCVVLGEYAQGESHADAIALLERVSQPLAKDLRLLLSLKSSAAYSARPTSGDEVKRATRAASRLVEAAAAAR